MRRAWIGLESWMGMWSALASYRWYDNKLYIQARSGADFPIEMDITNVAPPDFTSVEHRYVIKLNRMNAEFWIDDRLRAVVLHGAMNISPISGPPYYVAGFRTPINAHLPLFLEIVDDTREGNITLDLKPGEITVLSGDPTPPRVWPLYLPGQDTLMAGYSASGTVTSHPVPVFGYKVKTWLFRAEQGGTVRLETLTRSGNWRTYDEDTGYSANENWKYIMEGQAVLARLVYEPSTTPSTIAEAEVVAI